MLAALIALGAVGIVFAMASVHGTMSAPQALAAPPAIAVPSMRYMPSAPPAMWAVNASASKNVNVQTSSSVARVGSRSGYWDTLHQALAAMPSEERRFDAVRQFARGAGRADTMPLRPDQLVAILADCASEDGRIGTMNVLAPYLGQSIRPDDASEILAAFYSDAGRAAATGAIAAHAAAH